MATSGNPFRFAPAYLLGLTLPLGIALRTATTGWSCFLPFVTAIGVVPLGDWFITGFESHALKSAPDPGSSRESAYSALLWLYVPFQMAVLLFALHILVTSGLTHWEAYGLALSTGFITGGIGITVAHELIHRRRPWERALGLSLLAMVLLMHFRVEHVFGHHKNVGTPEDPATARRGESLYAYYFRAIPGALRHAWALERKKGLGRNRILHYLLIQIGIVIALGWAGGLLAVGFFVFQAWTAWLLLATIDYVEHYGLRRRETSPGRYEPVGGAHSWDSPNPVPNAFLFNLGLHSAHHLEPFKPYQKLRPVFAAPRLPAGYPTMLLFALFPPIWRKLMDNRAP